MCQWQRTFVVVVSVSLYVVIRRPGLARRGRHTSPIHDFLCVARKRGFSSLRIDVKLFGPNSKVLDECSKHIGRNTPPVLCSILVEECMHDLDRLIGELVGFDDPLTSESEVRATSVARKGVYMPCLQTILTIRRHSVLSGRSCMETSHFSTAVSFSRTSPKRPLKTESRA